KIGDKFGDNIVCSIIKVYRKVPTYNLEVEIYHTYAVVWGEGVSVVHNKTTDENSPPSGGSRPPIPPT
ncbi:MAG TPA: hypothetical protein ENI42_01940, partial [Thermoplasmatales archaeon]|nr:hypothetical protein [Thermoplasmatales archaeon]